MIAPDDAPEADPAFCWVHAVIETHPNPHQVCFECNHTYPTWWALYRDHMRVVTQILRHDFRSHPRETLRMLAHHLTRPTRIHVCPHCTHDF